MNNGTLLRLRNFRTYGDDPRNYMEFSPDQEKSAQFKRVFVCLLLGTEGYQILDKKGKQVMAPLNETHALNQLGWLCEDQLLAAGITPKQIEKAYKQKKPKK